MKRKIFSLFCCTVLLTSSLPKEFVKAEEEMDIVPIKTEVQEEMMPIASSPNEAEEGGATSQQLEKALIAVRSKIDIPEELLENFEYDYQEGSRYSQAQWSFLWSNDNRKITVVCDKDYHIKSYSDDVYNQGQTIPVYLKSELESVAEEFIKRVLPDIASSLQLSESNFTNFWNGSYSFVYERVEQGILMPENTITIQVNAATGKIYRMNSAFIYGISIPSQKAVLTAEQAAEKLEKDDVMQLVYRNFYERDPKTKEFKITAKLVYIPKDSYRSVDAVTGEVYTERIYDRYYWDINNSVSDKIESATDEEAGSSNVTLSEAEQKEIEKLGKYLSKEEAITKIKNNPSLYLEDTLTSIEASLKKQKDYWGNDIYVWEIRMVDPTKKNDIWLDSGEIDSYRAYASATINAENGNLLAFSANIRSYYNGYGSSIPEKKYTMEQCKQTTEKIVKANLNQLYKNSRLSIQEEGAYVLDRDTKEDVYGGYEFKYVRVNEGIDYPYHFLYVTVDAVSGKVLQFDYNWNNKVTFESPKNILSVAEAFSAYMKTDEYHLIYEMVNADSENSLQSSSAPAVRLVYRNDLTPAAISPYTGEPVQQNGAPIKKVEQYSYNDIDTLEQKRQILLLADLGLGFEGQNFSKDQTITTKEWIALAERIFSVNSSQSDNNAETISRQELASWIIQDLGFEKVAKLQGIYTTGFEDESAISKEYLGSVALIKGFDLMTAKEGNKFQPTEKVTRLEAVELFFKLLDLKITSDIK